MVGNRRSKSKAEERPDKLPKQKVKERAGTNETVNVGHVSKRQVTALIAFLLGVKALLITPTFVIDDVSTAAWISVAISGVVAFIGLTGWLKWSKMTAGMSLYPALKKTVGSPLAWLTCVGLMVGFIIGNALSMRIFAGGAVIGLLPEFPIEALLLVLIISSAYAAWLGLENVARGATFFLVPTLVSFILVILAAIRGFDTRQLTPVMGPGPSRVALEGLRLTGLWGGAPAFLLLKPYVRSETDLANGTRKGLLMAVLGLILAVVALLLFFSYPASTRITSPMGMLARATYLGRYLQRIEAIFVFTWFFASAIQASFVGFVLVSTVAQLSKTRTYRPFLPALASLSFGIALGPASTLRAAQLLGTYFYSYFGNTFMVLGWVLYGVARARGLKDTQSEDRELDARGGETRDDGDKEKKSSLDDSGPLSNSISHVSVGDGMLGKERD